MPSWHVAASGQGSLIDQELPKTSVSFQHRRPPEAPIVALVVPRAYTGAEFPEIHRKEECLEQRGRGGTARDLASNDTINEQGGGSCLWCCITHVGERLLVTLMSAGSLFFAETTLQTGIGLSDGVCSILAIAFLDEGRQVEAL